MKITSRIRIILIPLAIVMLSVLAMVPFSVYFVNVAGLKVYNSYGNISWQALLMSFFFLFVFLFFLYRIIFRTLLVIIDSNEEIITFHYPFKFFRKSYSFKEVIGFRLSNWHSKICYFKSLDFKTTGNKIYRFTDFEIVNFRLLEKYAMDNFIFCKGNSFLPLTDLEKAKEKQDSITFDVSQAKDYRLSSYMLIALLVAILFIDKYVEGPPDRKMGLLGYCLWGLTLTFPITKIIQANKVIKSYS